MIQASDVAVTIVPRVSAAGHPFAEVLFAWQEDGEPCNALTRYWYPVSDTPHARTNEAQQFVRRRNRQ